MKKIILSAASLAVAAVASVSVAPTTSEAIPAFARQTGSACLACHFQSFPTLAAYGRAFKLGGMTDTSVEMVEDEHLSIPAALNWTVMVRPNFGTTTTSVTGAADATTNYFEFADQVFMIGGRGGEHTGVFLEVGGGAYANAQMINSWDMGDLKAGVTVFSAGFGEDAAMQVMSVWGQHGGMLGGKNLSINQRMYSTSGSDVQNGVGAFVGNDVWVASLSMVNNVDAPEAGKQTNLAFAPVIRGNYFLEAGDWEVGLGLIAVTGTAGASTNGVRADQKRTGFDVQAFGEVGDMQIGIFADYATAPSGSVYASAADSRDGYSFRVSVKPMAQWIFLAGIGSDSMGNTTADTVRVGVEYEFYQNFAVQLVYDTEDDGTTKTTNTVIDLELLV